MRETGQRGNGAVLDEPEKRSLPCRFLLALSGAGDYIRAMDDANKTTAAAEVAFTLAAINVGDEIEVTADTLKPRRLTVIGRDDKYIFTTSGKPWGSNRIQGGAIRVVGFGGEGPSYQPTMMQQVRRLVAVRVLRTAAQRN